MDSNGKVSSQLDDVTKQNSFAVQWSSAGFPIPTAGTCPGGCSTSGGGRTCTCSAEVEVQPVFAHVPSGTELRAKLKVGAFPPGISCTSCGGEVKAYAVSGTIDARTVFEYAGSFYRNMFAVVKLGSSGYSFRNPPTFLIRDQQTGRPLMQGGPRAALAEVESLLDHLFHHPNTPAFIGHKLIQRLVTSSPSAAYLRDVSEAFRSGKHGGVVYSGVYGDLAATAAAILLHPEARDEQANGVHRGKLREPIVKVIHFMRAMGYAEGGDREIVLQDLEDVFGQAPYQTPSVFNFYLPEYQPPGWPHGVVAPEFQIFTAPFMLGFLNGMLALIKNGLSSCDEGFGLFHQTCVQGTFSARAELSKLNTSDKLAALDLLLTGARLSPNNMAISQNAYETAKGRRRRRQNSPLEEGDRIAAAQEAIVMTPEFHTIGNPLPGSPRPPTTIEGVAAPASYKAAVMLFMKGGADTFNMLVPLRCDLYNQYAAVRGLAALQVGQLLEVSTTGQACTNFGIHHKLPFVKKLYDEKDAAFVSNVGSLVRPITKHEFRQGSSVTASKCVGLFSHSDQQQAAYTMKCQVAGSSPKGVGGRIADALSQQGYRTQSFSVAGASTWAQGFDTNPEIIDKRHGALRPAETVQTSIANITSHTYSNIYCEEYQRQVAAGVESSLKLADLLDDVNLKTDYAAETDLAKQLNQVARLIATREHRKAERDLFFVAIGGFDTHSDLFETVDTKFEQIDGALEQFVSELKAQGVFQDAIVATGSDFGRTLTSNGKGTDHGWAGNHLVLGGTVNGGRVYNDFPASLLNSEQDAGRGRLIPKYPFESVMVPVAEWLGVGQPNKAAVFPNLANFNSTHIIPLQTLFNSGR